MISVKITWIEALTIGGQGFDSLLIEACLPHTGQNEIRASYNRPDYL